MAYIKINSKYPLYDGMPITFKAPCDCTATEGLTVNSTNFVFKDAHGNTLTGIGNLFGKDAVVKVILDKTNGCAYIQNADSNKYLEDRMSAAEAGVNANGASIENNRKSIASLASKVDRNGKRLATLEAVVYGDLAQEAEDNTVAYVKDVPADACPFAEVNSLGGMTRKCTNLTTAQAVYAGADKYLETVVDGRNCIRFTSGYEKKNTPITFKPNTQYTASFYAKSENYGGADTGNACITFFYEDGSFSMLQIGVDTSWRFFTLTSASGKTVKAIGAASIEWRAYVYLDTDTFMLNEGSTALPYEPYFEGLRSAPVTEVESVGVNLFDISKLSGMDRLVVSGDKINITTVSNNSCVTSASRLKDVAPQLKVGDIVTLTAITTGSDKYIYLEEALMAWYYGVQQTITEVMLNSRISFYASGVSTSATISEIMLNKGSALPYTPYTRNTLPIPEAVQALDGYGEGVNESVYNYIDYEKKQFVKRVGKVDLGTLTWSLNGGFMLARAAENEILLQAKIPASLYDAVPAISTVYEAASWVDVQNKTKDKSIAVYGGSSGGLLVNDTSYTDAATFKAAMSGVMLYYELATPEVTDISDILPADNYIGVEGGGTLTFKNQYEFDVPSEVTYITKGAESE